MMLAVLFTPPGMIVSPPAMLETMFETPIAISVRLGFDLRWNGSILSIAITVASDSMPSIKVSVMTVVVIAIQRLESFHAPRKWGIWNPWLSGFAGMLIS